VNTGAIGLLPLVYRYSDYFRRIGFCVSAAHITWMKRIQSSATYWKSVFGDNSRKNLLALWPSVSQVDKDVPLVQTVRTHNKTRTTDQVRRRRMHEVKRPRQHTPTSIDEFRSTGCTNFTFNRDQLMLYQPFAFL
jgi:hypothetical protein